MNSTKSSVYLYAMMMIQRTEPFDAFATHLTQLMPGFVFREDESGRYEDIPAYVATAGEMEFLLMGIPPDDESIDDEYRLEFSCTTNRPIDELFQVPGGEFVQKFVKQKQLNSRGTVEYAQELADLLTSLGIPGCKPIIVGD